MIKPNSMAYSPLTSACALAPHLCAASCQKARLAATHKVGFFRRKFERTPVANRLGGPDSRQQATLYQTAVVRTRATEFAEPLRDAVERLFRVKRSASYICISFHFLFRNQCFQRLIRRISRPPPLYPSRVR